MLPSNEEEANGVVFTSTAGTEAAAKVKNQSGIRWITHRHGDGYIKCPRHNPQQTVDRKPEGNTQDCWGSRGEIRQGNSYFKVKVNKKKKKKKSLDTHNKARSGQPSRYKHGKAHCIRNPE